MKNKQLYQIAALVVLLCAGIFCIKQIGEPDVWWQIRTGEYIIENGEVPQVDVFSFTHDGEPWINVKWLTEVVMALFSEWFGPEFLMLQQALALFAMLLFLLLSAKELRSLLGYDAGKWNNPAALLALLPFLLGMSFRLNGRPEMVSHVFTCFFLYLMIRYRNRADKAVFFFIPAMLLWANMHEAYGVGMVLLILYNLLSWLEIQFIKKSPNKLSIKNGKRLTLVSVLALVSTAIHPGGTKMISHPFEIYGQLGENKFTTELYSFTEDIYWNLATYLALGIFVVILIYIFINFKEKLKLLEKIGLPLLVVFAALTYLSLQAYRNAPFFLFASFPYLAFLLHQWLKPKFAAILAIVLASMLYVAVGSGTYYKTFLPREKYGLRVDPTRNPIGAASFLEEHKIGGKGFVDYFTSSYLLWYLSPEYKSFIDLRDLDIFSAKFMENVIMSFRFPNQDFKGQSIFNAMDSYDNFNYAIVNNKAAFKPMLKYLYRHEKFELVYVDLNSSVFLKRSSENKDLIEKFSGSFEQKFHVHKSLETPPTAKALSQIFWPAYQELDYSGLNYGPGKKILKRYFGLKQ